MTTLATATTSGTKEVGLSQLPPETTISFADSEPVRLFSEEHQRVFSPDLMRLQASLALVLSAGINVGGKSMSHVQGLLKQVAESDPSKDSLPCRPHHEDFLIAGDVQGKLSSEGWTGRTVEWRVEIWSKGSDRVTVDQCKPYDPVPEAWQKHAEAARTILKFGKDRLLSLADQEGFDVIGGLLRGREDWGTITFDELNAICSRVPAQVQGFVEKVSNLNADN